MRAPEFFTSGAKLVGMPGGRGKITPEVLARTLAAYPRGLVKQVQPATLTLSQATESGTIYTTAEIAELAEAAHRKGVAVHMDGARFSNALVSLGCTPAEMTWKAGVDVLSLGGTKNGAVMCEAVVFFDRERASDFLYLRKRGGQHRVERPLSWRTTSGMARRRPLARTGAPRQRTGARSRIRLAVRSRRPFALGTAGQRGFRDTPGAVNKALKDAGARFYDWGGRGLDEGDGLRDGEVLVRMVTSFATTPEHVSKFCAIALDAAT